MSVSAEFDCSSSFTAPASWRSRATANAAPGSRCAARRGKARKERTTIECRRMAAAYYDCPRMTALSIEELAATSDDLAVRRRYDARNVVWLTFLLLGFAVVSL